MKKKAKKEFGEATRASIMKEMAKPRMTKSAREEEANRAAGQGSLRIAPAMQGVLRDHLWNMEETAARKH